MVNLKNIIIPKFYPIHKAIKNNEYTEYWLKGGRSSTKSSFAAIEIILGLMKDPVAHCACFRKVGDTLKSSVFNQLLWAINILGVQNFFSYTISPLQIVYKPTKQTIIFRGLDKPEKIKSIKPIFGYFKYAWFEELAEFDGMEEIRNVLQSLQRGGCIFCYFFTYNPPINNNNWVNQEANKIKNNRIISVSTYLDVPCEWLGEAFLIEAELLKKTNEKAYRHEYLGEAVGSGLQVFNNLEIRSITDQEISRFDNIRVGLDFGYALHKMACVRLHYDYTRKIIYIFDEIAGLGLSNQQLMDKIKQKRFNDVEIQCDSAEPKSIRELDDYGLAVRGVKKGAGSITYGIKFLQGMTKIVIDNNRCPITYKQFIEYEYIKMKDGTIREDYPDIEDDAIDASRYALNCDMPYTRK